MDQCIDPNLFEGNNAQNYFQSINQSIFLFEGVLEWNCTLHERSLWNPVNLCVFKIGTIVYKIWK